MKTVLVLLVAVAMVNSDDYGIPWRECPSGEHTVLYCPQMAEPSCENPKVHEYPIDFPVLPCDIPECFCNEPTLRNTKTGNCVNFSDC